MRNHVSIWRGLVATAVGLTAVLVPALSSSAASAGGGNIMPPSAQPHGYSEATLTADNVNFGFSGNSDLTLLPQTPFQFLYSAPDTTSNTFNVKPGTPCFVPIFADDDSSPPVLPTSQKEAAALVFDSSGYGGRFSVTVDGLKTIIGRDYVFPQTSLPTPDIFGGTHIIGLGVVLTPFSPGTHTVILDGTFNGALASGGFAFTYTVHVG